VYIYDVKVEGVQTCPHLLLAAALGVLNLGVHGHDLSLELACGLRCSSLAVAGSSKLVLRLPASNKKQPAADGAISMYMPPAKSMLLMPDWPILVE
jgi:hypothetical protein